MTANLGLVMALVAMAVLLVVLTVAIAVCKAARSLDERRLAPVAARLRPQIVRLLADEDGTDPGPTPRTRTERRVLEALVADYLPKVRGEARSTLVALLERQGAVEEARRRVRRIGATGRGRAAELLGAVGSADAKAELQALLSDRQADIRIVAARSLGKLCEPDAVPALLAALDGSRTVPAGVVAMAVLAIGPDAAPALEDAVGTRPVIARRLAAELLGHVAGPGATDALLARMVDDSDEQVRARAAGSLGRIGSPRSLEHLVECLGSDAPTAVRAAAAAALGDLGGAAAEPALVAALDDEHLVAHAAARSLSRLGRHGRSALRALRDAGDGLRTEHAAEALAFSALEDELAASAGRPAAFA